MGIADYESGKMPKSESFCVPQTTESKLGRFKKKATEWAWSIGVAATISIGGSLANTNLSRADGEKLFGSPPIAWAHPPREDELNFNGVRFGIPPKIQEGEMTKILALGTNVEEEALENQGCAPTLTIPNAGVIASCREGIPSFPNVEVYDNTVVGSDSSWTTQQKYLVGAWNGLFVRWQEPEDSIPAGSELAITVPISTQNRENSSNDLGPSFSQTSVIMGGKIAVRIAFMESDGTVDSSTEDWTEEGKEAVFSGIVGGLNWWTDHAPPNAHLQFVVDPSSIESVETEVEPISHPSSFRNRWMGDAMTAFGYDITGIQVVDVERAYVNDLRSRLGTDWGGLIFAINGTNDYDHLFEDYIYAFAPLSGPYSVMTSTNNPEYISLARTSAHEFTHEFAGAMDAYKMAQAPCSSVWGFLQVSNGNGEFNNSTDPACKTNEPDVMRAWIRNKFFYLPTVNKFTRGQVGWGNATDGIPDAMRNDFAFSSLQITDTIGLGSLEIVPIVPPNPWETPFTINRIEQVVSSINGDPYQTTVAIDGEFDSPIENFQFTITDVYSDNPPIGVKVVDSAGNQGEVGFFERASTTASELPSQLDQGDILAITTTVAALDISKDIVRGAQCRIGDEDWQSGVLIGGGTGSMYGPKQSFLCQMGTIGLEGVYSVQARGVVGPVSSESSDFYDVTPYQGVVEILGNAPPPTPSPTLSPTPSPTPPAEYLIYLPLVLK